MKRIPLIIALFLYGHLLTGGEAPFKPARDIKEFPQATPLEALSSSLKARKSGKYAYLIANLVIVSGNIGTKKEFYEWVEEIASEDMGDIGKGMLEDLAKAVADGQAKVTGDTAVISAGKIAYSLSKRGAAWYVDERFVDGPNIKVIGTPPDSQKSP